MMNLITSLATRRTLAVLAVLSLIPIGWAVHRDHARAPSSEPLAHVQNQFDFTVRAPMALAAHLFGPEAERGWGGGDWNPHFFYPEPAKDVEGAVFTVPHGHHESLWVVTALDFSGGHVQYVSIMDDVVLTRIDIHLKPLSAAETAVSVAYERTALKAAVNEHVKELGQRDSRAGKHWELSLNEYLKTLERPRS